MRFTGEPRKKNRSGVALIIILILMTMMVGFLTLNALALSSLRREIKLIEHRQMVRLAKATNAPISLEVEAK